VRFHGCLFEAEDRQQRIEPRRKPEQNKCARGQILDAPKVDWMEWQAGHVCGALLMPVTELKRVVTTFMRDNRLDGPLPVAEPEGLALRDAVATYFDVSGDAARVRLLRVGHLVNGAVPKSLF
jgi:hypothetical protein